MKTLKLLGISGSLREDSLNTALLRAAATRLPEGASLTLASIDLPLYNADLKGHEGVERFQAQVAEADGVLIATPEYNYSVPGPLKNALDWASRPAYRSVFAGKPVGVIGAAGSVVGTARAQGHLKQILLGMVSHVFPWPELLVGQAHQRFEGGTLHDETTDRLLREYLEAFSAYAARLTSG